MSQPGPFPLPRFPSTRFQGSKRKILPLLAEIFDNIRFRNALDLYSGSGMVTLLMRYLNKGVASNDYLLFNCLTARLFLQVSSDDFSINRFQDTLFYLLNEAPLSTECKVSNNYKGVFFLDTENEQIDRFCQNITGSGLTRIEIDQLIYCVGQALLMKRPYNLFHRANLDMRTRHVHRGFGNAKTWETPIFDLASRIYKELASFPFPEISTNNLPDVHNINTLNLESLPKDYDLVYIDPPYLNRKGVGLKYTDFYHFLDGLCDYSLFENATNNYAHRPIISSNSAWISEDGAIDELERVVKHWPKAVLVVSYRNDGCPDEDTLAQILSSENREVNLHREVEYKYALSHSQQTREQVLVSVPKLAKEMGSH